MYLSIYKRSPVYGRIMWKRDLNHLEREKSNSLANQEKLTVEFGLERNAFEEIAICFVGGHLL